MKRITYHLFLTSTLVMTAGLLMGCSSGVKNPSGANVTEMKADERGFVAGTGIESQDLVAVTEKMGRSILGIPEIANAQSTPRIVLEPVVNESRFPINKDIFLTRIRTQLNSKSSGKVRFLARENMAALEKKRSLKQNLHCLNTSLLVRRFQARPGEVSPPQVEADEEQSITPA